MTKAISNEKVLKYIVTMTEFLEDWETLCRSSEGDFNTHKAVPCTMLSILVDIIKSDQKITNIEKEKLCSMADVIRMRVIFAKDCNVLEGIESVPLPISESWEENL